ncbi:MAG: RNA polymerase sigma factor [Caldilineaceae bacterium]
MLRINYPKQALETLTDQELIRLAAQEQAAFTHLYRRYVKRVYGYLYSRVGNVEDAQDLTAQTFLGALGQLAGYRGTGSVAAWLVGIAHHKWVDWQRQRRPSISLSAVENLADPAALPDEVFLQQLQRETLEQALHGLTPERAEAIALRFFGELSNREVAVIMQKPESAVKMLVHRGLQDLRVRLTPIKERIV